MSYSFLKNGMILIPNAKINRPQTKYFPLLASYFLPYDIPPELLSFQLNPKKRDYNFLIYKRERPITFVAIDDSYIKTLII